VVEQPLLEGAGAVEVDVALQHAVEHGQQAGQPGVPPEDAADQPAQPAGVAGPLGLQGGVQVGEPGVEPLGGQGQEQALLGPVVEERRPLGQPGLLGDAGHGHLGVRRGLEEGPGGVEEVAAAPLLVVLAPRPATMRITCPSAGYAVLRSFCCACARRGALRRRRAHGERP
jgi:hypothetical protein